MILVDPREGSSNYPPYLRAMGANVTETPLEFGDVAFFGSGRSIGIELKKVDDVMQCITTGRFAGHQLPGLARDYNEAWLIVEGLWRPHPEDGSLEVWRGGWRPLKLGARTWMYRDLDSFLTTQEVKGGVRVKRTSNEQETARAIMGLYAWWQDFEGHKSHLALNRTMQTTFVKPTLVRRVAAELDGIGYEKSGMIAGHFATVRAMMNATVKEWMKLPGIGKKLAAQIVGAWDSED